MIRKIIEIDTDKCTGCALCVNACHEGAIGLINGKAVLLRDDYCDGLGDCLPACPVGAISFTEREADAYDHAAVMAKKLQTESAAHCDCSEIEAKSCLTQWPVQIKLAPVQAPYFQNASLLIAADCTAYAYAAFHENFMSNRITLIGCPKLDSVDYSEKLTHIISRNDIQDILVVRMEVPCCGGMEMAVKKALQKSGKEINCQTVIISTDGKVLL